MNAPASPPSEISPARLVIVDDHALIRAGLRSMLEAEPDLQIVGEAANGREAIQLCHRLQPDVVLMDLRMPVMDGVAATQAIKAECPSTHVIILTIRDSPDYLNGAREAGADAYLLKEISHQEIATAIRQVLQGESIHNQRHPSIG